MHTPIGRRLGGLSGIGLGRHDRSPLHNLQGQNVARSQAFKSERRAAASTSTAQGDWLRPRTSGCMTAPPDRPGAFGSWLRPAPKHLSHLRLSDLGYAKVNARHVRRSALPQRFGSRRLPCYRLVHSAERFPGNNDFQQRHRWRTTRLRGVNECSVECSLRVPTPDCGIASSEPPSTGAAPPKPTCARPNA